MSDEADNEGRPGAGRVEAFSDGVVAIIVTIMVLELHPPLAEGMGRLWSLWPVFVAYVLSYAYVAIYWVNHHQLFGYARRVGNALIWSNVLLLFALSLVPFATSYLGEHHFGQGPVLFYLVTLMLPSLAYTWLQRTVRLTGDRSARAMRYHRRTQRKGAAATLLYAIGLLFTLAGWPWLGVGCAAVVALLWLLPIGPVDRLFD